MLPVTFTPDLHFNDLLWLVNAHCIRAAHAIRMGFQCAIMDLKNAYDPFFSNTAHYNAWHCDTLYIALHCTMHRGGFDNEQLCC